MAFVRNLASIYRSKQFVGFVAVGGIAALANWLARILINEFVDFSWSVVGAYVVGMATAYVLNRKYVFPFSGRPKAQELSIFVAVNILSFPLVWCISVLLGEWIFPQWVDVSIAKAAGHAIALAFPAVISFAVHKFITFAPPWS